MVRSQSQISCCRTQKMTVRASFHALYMCIKVIDVTGGLFYLGAEVSGDFGEEGGYVLGAALCKAKGEGGKAWIPLAWRGAIYSWLHHTAVSPTGECCTTSLHFGSFWFEMDFCSLTCVWLVLQLPGHEELVQEWGRRDVKYCHDSSHG